MRKTKKFAKGGGAEAKRDRRMADIESDYNRAIARGQSEKEARAKRAQREADARDDYAKRTGGDRTQTRAAERAAEQRLSATRRSPDKDMKPVSVASEGPQRKPLVDTSAKADTPSPGASKPAAGAPKPAAPRSAPKPAATRSAPKPAAPRSAPKPDAPTYRANFGKPTIPGRATTTAPAAKPKPAAPATVNEFLRGSVLSNPGTGVRVEPTRAQRLETAVRRFLAGRNRDKISDYAKGGKVKAYAKGGSIDGIAVRGKTKAKRKK